MYQHNKSASKASEFLLLKICLYGFFGIDFSNKNIGNTEQFAVILQKMQHASFLILNSTPPLFHFLIVHLDN